MPPVIYTTLGGGIKRHGTAKYTIITGTKYSLIITRFNANSKDRMPVKLSGHASVPYNKTGKHFTFIKFRTTSSDAERPMQP